jgi:hypothetical protein
VTDASAKATRKLPEVTAAHTVKIDPVETEARRVIFISALATDTDRPWTDVTTEAPIAESQNAARNPPCIIPAGFSNRSWAVIRHVVIPGDVLSMQTIPRVRSLFGGT